MLELGLIQDGVSRTFDHRWILTAMAWRDVAGFVSSHLAYGHGKVIPAAYTFVAVVIGTRISSPGFPVENGGDGFCKVQCIGGRTCLVKDHIDLRLLSGKLQHGAAEVLSIFAIKPCRTYDKMVYT